MSSRTQFNTGKENSQDRRSKTAFSSTNPAAKQPLLVSSVKPNQNAIKNPNLINVKPVSKPAATRTTTKQNPIEDMASKMSSLTTGSSKGSSSDSAKETTTKDSATASNIDKINDDNNAAQKPKSWSLVNFDIGRPLGKKSEVIHH